MPTREATPVWQFRVGQGDAPVDTVRGFDPDFDGDGFSDVVEDPSAADPVGGVSISPGGASGIAAAPPLTLAGFGSSHVSIGDTNGDGYGDLALLQHIDATHDRVSIFFGGASGVTTRGAVIEPGAVRSGYWIHVGALGDIDRDGYGDVAIGRMTTTTAADEVEPTRFYRGGPDGPELASVRAPRYAAGDGFDVNGDGYPDVATSRTDAAGDAVTLVYPGGPDGIGAVALPGTPRGFPFGDFNGDGYADLGRCVTPVADMGLWSRCEVYLGGRDGARSVVGYEFAVSQLGSRLSGVLNSVWSNGAADVNGDGLDDLLIGTSSRRESSAQISFALFGTTETTADRYSLLVVWLSLTVLPAPTGDVDGDGFDDVMHQLPESWDPTVTPIRGALVFGASGDSTARRVQLLAPR